MSEAMLRRCLRHPLGDVNIASDLIVFIRSVDYKKAKYVLCSEFATVTTTWKQRKTRKQKFSMSDPRPSGSPTKNPCTTTEHFNMRKRKSWNSSQYSYANGSRFLQSLIDLDHRHEVQMSLRSKSQQVAAYICREDTLESISHIRNSPTNWFYYRAIAKKLDAFWEFSTIDRSLYSTPGRQ